MLDLVAFAPIGRNLQDRGTTQAAMGEQHRFVEHRLAMPHPGLDGDTGQRLQPLQQRLVEGQRHQGGPRLRHRQAELPGEAIAEIARAHFGNGFSARRNHQRAALHRFAVQEPQQKTFRRFLDLIDFAVQAQLRVGLPHFGKKKIDDLLGRSIAEQLAQGFFVIGDAVALDQRDEILRRVAAERRNAEMRIGGEKLRGAWRFDW